MTITGSGGAVLTITPVSGLAEIALDLNGDGVVEFQNTHTWSELEDPPV